MYLLEGKRDIKNNSVVLVRRDIGEKMNVNKENVVQEIESSFELIQSNLFNEALKIRKKNTFSVVSFDQFKETINKGGFIKCGWDGNPETEKKIKDQTKATIRLIPFDEKPDKLKCIYSGKPARHEVIFAKGY